MIWRLEKARVDELGGERSRQGWAEVRGLWVDEEERGMEIRGRGVRVERRRTACEVADKKDGWSERQWSAGSISAKRCSLQTAA